MPDIYSYPTDAVDLGGFISSINGATGNVLAPLLLLGIFGVSFLAMREGSQKEAFSASTFITSIASYGFFWGGLIEPTIILIPTFLFAVSLFFLVRSP